jgi:flagellar motility protein MotE (MotC chaperone)
MNRQQFINWMNDPASLDADSVSDLHALTIDYPYFQAARLLYLLNLKQVQDYRFDPELRRVAAFSADRARLRDWLVFTDNNVSAGKALRKDELMQQPALKAETDAHLKTLEEKIKESLDEIEAKKNRLRELIEEKKAILGDFDDKTEDLGDQNRKFSLRPLPKDELLEEFIRQKQNQPQNRVTFYSPEESARRSIEENDGILSETLARLMAAQGKKDKAIKIYQKLMLKNPQKSSYFAAQIEKLRKES